MKQDALKLDLNLEKTRKQVLLEQMEQVVPWADLVELIAPYYPEGKTGRPPFSLHTMLRTHFMQQWFTLSDPAMEEAFFDTPLYREFAQLEEFARLPDESTILRFRHRLEKYKLSEQILKAVNDLLIQRGLLLKAGTAVDATLIAAPTSTKNKDKARDPEMHSSQKGKQWHFGMKAHIGADAQSGLVHTVRGTSGNVHDVVEGSSLLHGDEVLAYGDAGYQGIDQASRCRQGRFLANCHAPRQAQGAQQRQPSGCPDRQGRKAQSWHSGQSGASVSGNQAPVRICQGSLPWLEEEHRPALHVICAVQSVDGARQIDGSTGMSAPENQAIAQRRARKASANRQNAEITGDFL